MHTIPKMKTTLQVLAVVAAIIAAGECATQIQKCNGGIAPSVNDVQVKLGDCTGRDGPCVLKKGESYTLEATFKSPVDADDVKLVVLGLPTGPLGSATDCEVCDHLSTPNGKKRCPLKKGQTYTYTNTYTTSERALPHVHNLEWHLVNESDESVACFQIPTKLG